MCSIIGTPNKNRLKLIQSYNKERGNFSTGIVCFDKHSFDIKVFKYAGISEDIETQIPDSFYYAVHLQAPTSSIRTFAANTTHPFICNGVYVQHNGVLTNDKYLKTKTKSPYNEVDSSVIPALINDKIMQGIDHVKSITDTLSDLQGTYTVWIVIDNKFFFGRAGSTLFMNQQTRELSSIKMPGIDTEVPEGILYQVFETCIQQVGTFKSNSPFFII